MNRIIWVAVQVRERSILRDEIVFQFEMTYGLTLNVLVHLIDLMLIEMQQKSLSFKVTLKISFNMYFLPHIYNMGHFTSYFFVMNENSFDENMLTKNLNLKCPQAVPK